MIYNQYTHNLVIQTSNNILKNACIYKENGITHIIKSSVQGTSQGKYSIVIPSFINLHSHLNYSDIKIKRRNLFNWMLDLVQKIQHLEEGPTPKAWAQRAALLGCKEALMSGTGFVVDNSNFPLETFLAMKETGLAGIIGIEIFGSDPNQAQSIFQEKIRLINSLPQDPHIRFTLSPHASYDVSAALWQLCQEWCDDHQLPLLSHVAESQEEEEWFRSKNAPNAIQFWSAINTLEPKLNHWQPYKSSIDYLARNNLLNCNSLLTHAVHASTEDLETLKKHDVKLVTCPRSNQLLENGFADYKNWNLLEVAYGVGTDSKASNYDLDLRKEVNAIPGLTAKKRFELITSDAAKILNRLELGSLNELSQSWSVLEITDPKIDLNNIDIFELIMDTKLSRIKEIWINGKIKLWT